MLKIFCRHCKKSVAKLTNQNEVLVSENKKLKQQLAEIKVVIKDHQKDKNV